MFVIDVLPRNLGLLFLPRRGESDRKIYGTVYMRQQTKPLKMSHQRLRKKHLKKLRRLPTSAGAYSVKTKRLQVTGSRKCAHLCNEISGAPERVVESLLNHTFSVKVKDTMLYPMGISCYALDVKMMATP